MRLSAALRLPALYLPVLRLPVLCLPVLCLLALSVPVAAGVPPGVTVTVTVELRGARVNREAPNALALRGLRGAPVPVPLRGPADPAHPEAFLRVVPARLSVAASGPGLWLRGPLFVCSERGRVCRRTELNIPVPAPATPGGARRVTVTDADLAREEPGLWRGR